MREEAEIRAEFCGEFHEKPSKTRAVTEEPFSSWARAAGGRAPLDDGSEHK